MSEHSAPVSVMIFTLNEEQNLPRCLDSLLWCDDVIVVDSFSKDRTEEIARARGARFFQNRFEGFGTQRNWAIDNTSPKHEWLLMLDADEQVRPELVADMARKLAAANPSIGAYRLTRRFHLWGRWLRHSSLYPTWMVRLVHKDRARYVNRGHAETQVVDGEIGQLEGDLIDENVKGIGDWFDRQVRYARKEAEFEVAQEQGRFPLGDLISSDPLARRAALKRAARGVPGRAHTYFLYSYLLAGGFLDGEDGLVYCSMRALYQHMIVIHKYDLRKRPEG